MADKKISQLTASTTPLAGTEILPIVQGAATVKVAVSDLTAGRAVSAASLALTGSALPVGSGGTGTSTAFTAGSVVFAGASGVYSQDNAVLFYDNANDRFGIGTATPSYRLDLSRVGGNGDSGQLVRFTNTSTGNSIGPLHLTIGTTNYFASNPGLVLAGTNGIGLAVGDGSDLAGQRKLTIDSAGIITMPAYGAGAATFSAAGVISSVSDETWKIKDGIPVDPDSMLKKLAPGYWYYNDEKKETFGIDRQLGFYAQNVNAAIGPEAAPTPEEGKPWGYHDRSVLAITVMSLQKALATIESLTARITALESK